MRLNGLYGHVRHNDVRSLGLFAGFVVAFQVLALLALLVPLAMFDPDHAPLYGWMGYLTRWVPIVTIIGALLFVAQMGWHVRVVRRRTRNGKDAGPSSWRGRHRRKAGGSGGARSQG